MAKKVQPDLDVLRTLFGDNRAEWPPEQFGELFVRPAYLDKLAARRPSILVGGRGTGKTTALKSLRFDSTFERLTADGMTIEDQQYFGVFVRVNKNHVRAFRGGGQDEELWDKTFAHYFNLLVCEELARLTLWIEEKTGAHLTDEHLESVSRDLALTPVCDSAALLKSINDALSGLTLFVNNPTRIDTPIFSMAETPLRTFAVALRSAGVLEGRSIYCCIDEYENLTDSQQRVLNTYIKHSEPPLSYKVGVVKNGLRSHQTVDGNVLLSFPDDYRQIEIDQEGFVQFARDVGNVRLARAKSRGVPVPERLDDLLETLTISDEAEQLGAGRVAKDVRREVAHLGELHAALSELPDADVYFLRYWSESEGSSIEDVVSDRIHNDAAWRDRYNNYGYTSLFWLSKGRKGARIRKFYCGTRVLLRLAGGNIRYFLELVDASIAQAESANELQVGPGEQIRISPKSQTLGAKAVATRRLRQLEGLSDRGVELKRLVLAVGKVFFELARNPLGRTPEVTSFVLAGDAAKQGRLHQLLSEGVAHLAFVAEPRTKETTPEIRDDEYRLHPVFSAFFEISHRRKRRTVFDAEKLLGVLGDRPSRAISDLLDNRDQTPREDLPDQLAFFTSFFESESK